MVVEPEDEEKADPFADSKRWSIFHPTRFMGHHEDRRASTSTEATAVSSLSSMSSTRKVVTSVLIAMPTPVPRKQSPTQSDSDSEHADENPPIPEVLFGVYEGQWKP